MCSQYRFTWSVLFEDEMPWIFILLVKEEALLSFQQRKLSYDNIAFERNWLELVYSPFTVRGTLAERK